MASNSGIVPEHYQATYRDWLDYPDDNVVRELIRGPVLAGQLDLTAIFTASKVTTNRPAR